MNHLLLAGVVFIATALIYGRTEAENKPYRIVYEIKDAVTDEILQVTTTTITPETMRFEHNVSSDAKFNIHVSSLEVLP